MSSYDSDTESGSSRSKKKAPRPDLSTADWPSWSMGGRWDQTGRYVINDLTFAREARMYTQYLLLWSLACICIIPCVIFSKKYLDKYPDKPPQDQEQLYGTAWYIYVGGLTIFTFGIMYVPYTYHGLYDRYHKNNVGSGELRRLSLDKLVDAHARSKGMITFEVFVCLLVFLSALGSCLYVSFNGASLVTDKNARNEELRQSCTKENNDFCEENKDLMASLIAATIASLLPLVYTIRFYRARKAADTRAEESEGLNGYGLDIGSAPPRSRAAHDDDEEEGDVAGARYQSRSRSRNRSRSPNGYQNRNGNGSNGRNGGRNQRNQSRGTSRNRSRSPGYSSEDEEASLAGFGHLPFPTHPPPARSKHGRHARDQSSSPYPGRGRRSY